MARLVINPDTTAAWEIALKSGANILGRADTSDVPVAHESVSSAHCELTVGPDGARIRDLGSSNGTLVNGELIQEAVLRSGDTLRVGEVAVRYLADGPQAARTVPVPAGGSCKYHPRSPARLFCPKCQLAYCELCVNLRTAGGKTGYFCRSCSSECTPVQAAPVETAGPEPSFFRTAFSAFSYPLRGDGIFLLLGGGAFLLLIDWAKYFAKFALLIGLIALLILTVFGAGYLVSYLRRILTSSAAGEDRIPDWPEVNGFGSDILSPFLQLLGTAAFSFAPAVILTMLRLTGSIEGDWTGWAVFASILLGAAYFPMAFTAVAMFDTVMAVNPLLIVPSILKIPLTYLATIALFALILLVRWLGNTFLPEIISPRFLSGIVASFLGLYLMLVEVRILGLMYRMNKYELGWFKR